MLIRMTKTSVSACTAPLERDQPQVITLGVNFNPAESKFHGVQRLEKSGFIDNASIDNADQAFNKIK